MKLFVALASLVVAISAASDHDMWVEFKKNHGKTYRSLREEKLRFNIFQEKLREIESHNAKYEKGEESYFLRVNQFADLTTDEFVAQLNKNFATKPKLHATPFENEVQANLTAPEEINWVEKGAVLEIKDQGNCGSCWAFSTTGSIEGQNAILNNVKIPLSEQQLVDCSKRNYGCKGGHIEDAFDYVKENGLSTETDYPYTGKDGTCEPAKSSIKVNGYVSVKADEYELQRAVGTVGPVSVALNSNLWQLYGGGVYDNILCWSYPRDHAVLVVGYGKADGTDYWLIKNSWGKSWGEEGYIRLVRNKFNQCGVAGDASYPKL